MRWGKGISPVYSFPLKKKSYDVRLYFTPWCFAEYPGLSHSKLTYKGKNMMFFLPFGFVSVTQNNRYKGKNLIYDKKVFHIFHKTSCDFTWTKNSFFLFVFPPFPHFLFFLSSFSLPFPLFLIFLGSKSYFSPKTKKLIWWYGTIHTKKISKWLFSLLLKHNIRFLLQTWFLFVICFE